MNKPGSHSEADRLSEKSREDIENKRKQIYQSMSAEEKLAAATDLYYWPLHLKRARIKRLHPEWSEEKIDKKPKSGCFMQRPEPFLVFLKPLNNLEIPYMITGSTAAIIYGEPRLTHVIDIIVDLTPKNVDRFYNAFDSDKFYVPPKEVLHIEMARTYKGHCNLLHQETGFKADIYMKGKDRLHAWAFENKVPEKIDSEKIWLAPPEYVIVRKLLFYQEGKSEKHLQDINNILTHQKEKIEKEEIEEKVKEYNLSESWNLTVGNQ